MKASFSSESEGFGFLGGAISYPGNQDTRNPGESSFHIDR
jgi:hypothetical protein